MNLPTESQWAQYSALCARLQPLPTPAREAALQALRATGEEDPQVLSLVAVHFALPPDPHRLHTGERLGNFTLEEPLGMGGMGVVYRAQQHIGSSRRPVAVKLLQPAMLLTARDEALERFLAEMHTLVTLQHENIARIYDGGIYDDPHTHEQIPYLAMELVQAGQPITTYARDYALSWQERLVLFVRVCHAVRYAHEHRIIHRDLKPANLLVDSEGRPFVIDFGLAQACDAILPGAHLAGTPAYMSPEQVSDAFGAISEKSDVYALGLILYELLTGQHPYALPHDGSFEQLCQVITEVRPPLLSQYDQAYSGELEALVAAALAKQPAARIPVAILRSRLERYLNHLLPDLERPRTLTTLQGPQDRQPPPLLDTVQSAGQLVPALHNTGLMIVSMETAPLPAVVHGKLTPPRRWLTGMCGKKYFAIGVGLLLCLVGLAATVFRHLLPLPATITSQSQPAPVVSSPALAYQALVQGDWAQAEVLFQRLVQQAEARVQSQGYGGLAAVAFARGAVQQASGFVAQAEALDPETAASQVIRGHILWREGKLGAAKMAYRMAADNTNALPWQQATAANRLGRIYAAEGLAGNALQYYDRAISQCPQMAPIYVNKAHLLEQLGRRPEALMLYRQAVQIDPDDPLAVTLLRQAERQEQLAQDRQQQTHLAQRVAALLHAHEAGRLPEHTGDDWTSAPLTLAFLAVQRLGSLAPQAGEEVFLISSLAQALRESGRIVVLDHALLERLLVELKQSTADLTDPQVALHVGHILAARLLATGTILHSQAEETLNLSLIEISTGALRARVETPWTPDAHVHIVEQLARALLPQVHQAYPVQGRITSVSPQGIALNIGADQGVTSGMTMQVFGNAEPDAPGRRVGLIEVTAVDTQRAQARVLEYAEVLQQGWRVQEVQQP